MISLRSECAWCSSYLLLADPCSRGRIVAIGAPRWMIEVEDKVAIVGSDSVVECERADAPPALEVTPLVQPHAVGLANIGDLDGEGNPVSGNTVTAVEDLAHDFVAEISADDQGLAALGKVAGVWRWLGNFPETRQANSVGMEQ